ncbi:hypothetical protein F4808DRAFT_357578 [Astrocystis sublimbata]|nr:hypothetical protein F4808DRAFT_357578 [Astrocystis sublimbata]
MPSVNAVLATATLLVASVNAQEQYHIDPSSVPLSLRANWCQTEKSTCPLICKQSPPGGFETNECDPMALTYGCVCEDGKSPNLSEYSLTLPFFICQEWGTQCVTACGSDATCASDCRQNHPCGAQNPTRANVTSSSSPSATETGMSATNSAGEIYNGLDGDGDSDSNSGDDKPKNGASPLLQYGSVVGGLALAACVGLGSLIL